MPGGPSPQQFRGAVQPPQNVPTPTGSAKPAKEESNAPRASVSPPEVATVKLPNAPTGSAATRNAQGAPPPPTESKPDVAAALAPPAQPPSSTNNAAATKVQPSGPKSGRIMPAVPFASANKNQMPTAPAAQAKAAPATQATKDEPAANKSIEEANRDARAAVAAAMAKLNNSGAARKAPETTGAMDNLTKKVNEMRTNDGIPRAPRNPGAAPRGGRAGLRQPARKIEVPKTDYDFETANAKFNKQDLVKEVIATGSPLASPGEGATPNAGVLEDAANGHKGGESTVVIPTAPGYNKSSSFFDDISSEIKDRAERAEGNAQVGDFRQFRNEERQKNLETFGQGSVDNGFRRGYGRGRGRGFGGRGRGRGGGGRGGVQGVVAEN
jgi:protein LSM14